MSAILERLCHFFTNGATAQVMVEGGDVADVPTSVPLLAAFLAVCTSEAVAAWLLWVGDRAGAFLAFATLPFGAVYWWGFALPAAPIVVVLSIVFLVLGWGPQLIDAPAPTRRTATAARLGAC